MDVYRSFDQVPAEHAGRALAVGTFDGVHVGHRRVIESALEWGRARGSPVAVVTFEPHPLQVLRPKDPPRLLASPAIKEDLIRQTGVDQLVVAPFTEAFSKLSAEEFCEGVLVDRLQARHVSVGANFRFGRDAAGDPDLLRSREEFETAAVALLEIDGEPVSSSRIRALLDKGDVCAARELLGAPFQLEGSVVKGDARGRSLGLPTANITPVEGTIVPSVGIYAGLVLEHPAAVSIGVRPTFGIDGPLLVEAYLLDFEGDLYGRTVRLSFLERLRDELRFDSAEQLVEQMHRDVEQVREISSRLAERK